VYRKLTRQQVIDVAMHPEQIIPAKGVRYFAQSRFMREGQEYLLRVLIEKDGDDYLVVTVYPTSKIRKYWQGGSQ
jgi:hypothetical protein